MLGEGPGEGFVAQGRADDQMALCPWQGQRRCAPTADLVRKAKKIGLRKAPVRGEVMDSGTEALAKGLRERFDLPVFSRAMAT